jgi:hypothetical protein
MVDMVSKIKVETHTPDVIVPEIQVPKAEVTVRGQKIEMPEINMPDEMNVKGFVQLMGVDLGNPLPVQLRTADGSPLDLMKSITAIGGGSGARQVTINNQSGNPVPITGDLSATLSADTGSGEIGSETLRMVMATDAIASVNIVAGSSSGTEYANGATALTPTGAVAMGNTGEESGNVFALAIGSGVTGSSVLRTVTAVDSVSSVNVVTSVGLTDTELRASSFNVGQVSGANWSTNVTQFNGNDVSTREGETDSGTLRVVHASDFAASVVASGVAAHDSAVSGNPVLTGLESRTTNPTAVGDGDVVRQRADKTGRAVMRPVQVRDLTQTAYVTASSEGEKTLLAGASGVYHDLIMMKGSNESDAAITLDIRQTTGGTVQDTLVIPANSTSGLVLSVPIPQDHTDATWTVDNNSSDASNTVYSVTALFSKEV